MLIKPKNLRETSAPHRWRPNIGPGPGEPKTRTAREKAGWEKRENEGGNRKKTQMKKNSSLLIHSPAHSRPCSSHFIPPSHRGGAPTRENEGKKGGWRKKKKLENCLSNITPVLRTGSVLSGEGKGRFRRRENKVRECIREASCSLAVINEGPNDMSIHTHSCFHQQTHTVPETQDYK